jgi:hypothetical protein
MVVGEPDGGKNTHHRGLRTQTTVDTFSAGFSLDPMVMREKYNTM